MFGFRKSRRSWVQKSNLWFTQSCFVELAACAQKRLRRVQPLIVAVNTRVQWTLFMHLCWTKLLWFFAAESSGPVQQTRREFKCLKLLFQAGNQSWVTFFLNIHDPVPLRPNCVRKVSCLVSLACGWKKKTLESLILDRPWPENSLRGG